MANVFNTHTKQTLNLELSNAGASLQKYVMGGIIFSGTTSQEGYNTQTMICDMNEKKLSE